MFADRFMRSVFGSSSLSGVRGLALTVLVWSLLGAAFAAKAANDANLTVEFRQITEDAADGASHYGAGSQTAPEWEPQTLQVRNGEKAQLQMNDSVPMQWVQSASDQSSSTQTSSSGSGAVATAPSATASSASRGSSVTQALVWMDAGQSLSVTPTWVPGRAYAILKIEASRAALGDNNGGPLPSQQRSTVATTVRTPLAEWVTVATTGRAQPAHSYSSEAGNRQRRLLQVRVMVP